MTSGEPYRLLIKEYLRDLNVIVHTTDEPEGVRHSEQEVVKDKSFEADNYDLDTFLHDLESEYHI